MSPRTEGAGSCGAPTQISRHRVRLTVRLLCARIKNRIRLMMQPAPTSRDVNQRLCQGHDIKGISKEKKKPTQSKNRYFESRQSLIGQTAFKDVKHADATQRYAAGTLRILM